jgi:hypothetical protein
MRCVLLLSLLIAFWPFAAASQPETVTGRATPQEAYQKVSDAAQFLKNAGAKGLKEFESPTGRFVWKDTFVWVTECERNYCLPTPRSRDIGLNLSQMKCHQTGKLYVLSLCDDIATHPEGAWVEHWQPRPGFDQPQRKLSFMMPVPGSPYQVAADVFDETTTMEQLNKISRRK